MTKRQKVYDRRVIPAGNIFIEQGNYGMRAFLIERGKVEVFRKDQRGGTIRIAQAGPGSIIGEMSMIDGKERSASVKALEETVVIAITMRDIEDTIHDPEGIFHRMMKVMVQRLKEMNDRMVQQNIDLADLQEAVESSSQKIVSQLPEGKRDEFKGEMVKLLDRIRDTLAKYNQI